MALFTRKISAIGIDVSDNSLRAIQIKQEGIKKYIRSYSSVDLPSGIVTKGEIIERKKFLQALKTLLEKPHGKPFVGKQIISVLPESKTFMQIITLPISAKSDLQKAIQNEIVNHIPLEIDEMYLDWQVINSSKQSITILVGAAPRAIVNTYLTIYDNSPMQATIFEIEAAAITRSLNPLDVTKPCIIVDFGATRSGLIVYDAGVVQFTLSLPISGIEITNIISKKLHLKIEQAENAKRVCGLDPAKCDNALLTILMNEIEKLAEHIIQAREYYKSHFKPQSDIQNVILCGGGANFSKIDAVISQKTSLTTLIASPIKNFSSKKSSPLPQDQHQSYITAIGLALRGLH